MTGGTPKAYLKLRDARDARKRGGHHPRHGLGGRRNLLASLWFRGYTIGEKINLWRGRAFSRSFGLGDQALHTDLRDVVPKLEIPVYIFQGRYDYTAATPLAHDYFEQFQAPVKSFYEVDNSAHRTTPSGWADVAVDTDCPRGTCQAV